MSPNCISSQVKWYPEEIICNPKVKDDSTGSDFMSDTNTADILRFVYTNCKAFSVIVKDIRDHVTPVATNG